MNFQRQESHKGATALIVATEEEARVQKQIAENESRLKAMTEDQANKQGAELESLQKQIAEMNQQLENERRQFAELTTRIPRVRQPRTNQQLAAQPLDRSETNIAPGQDPRELLAQWMTDPGNENFSGSMVNRLWRHFFAVGLVEPVDDLRISNPPSNRELWTALNHEFVSHKYDLRHIMRLILNSRIYQLSSATLKGNAAERGFYSHYYVRRLPAEVFLDAISQSTLIPDSFPGYPVGMRAIQLPDSTVASPFLSMFGRSERVTACACERSGDVTLPQLLHLQCGDGLAQKFDDPVGRLKQIMNSFPDDKSAIEQIYLATLSRSPTTEEQASITAAFEGNEQREEAFRDLFWALLNTKEFAFNH
jgi:TolA-binding protein